MKNFISERLSEKVYPKTSFSVLMLHSVMNLFHIKHPMPEIEAHTLLSFLNKPIAESLTEASLIRLYLTARLVDKVRDACYKTFGSLDALTNESDKCRLNDFVKPTTEKKTLYTDKKNLYLAEDDDLNLFELQPLLKKKSIIPNEDPSDNEFDIQLGSRPKQNITVNVLHEEKPAPDNSPEQENKFSLR